MKPPQKPSNSNRWVWITLAVILVIFLIGRIASLGSDEDGLGLGDKVGLLRIEGPIMDSRKAVADLDALAERNDIKAIVLRIDSPGGAIAPTEEIYEKVRKVRASLPVVTSMGSVAASGGYYIAVGSSRIMANKGTITGSIGVIMEYPVMDRLLDKVGVNIETVKSGAMKDAGSPSRPVTEADRRYFQSITQELHQQFIETVAKERSMGLSQVIELADGRVFTGTQSLELGLIDTLGTLEDAINLAGELGEISGKPKVYQIKHRKDDLLDILSSGGEAIGNTWFDRIPAYRWRGDMQ